MEGPELSDADQDEVLRARALDGLAALVELLTGPDPAPRLAGAPAGLISVLEALTNDAHRSQKRTDDVVSQILAASAGGPRMCALTMSRWEAVCDLHLLPFGGRICVAYDPGLTAPYLSQSQLDWITSLHAGGLTSPQRIATRLSYLLFVKLGGRGAVVYVRTDTACPSTLGHDAGAVTIVKGVIKDARIQALLANVEPPRPAN